MDQYILVIKFVWTQLQHLEESKQLQDKEEDFDIMEDSGSTILTARHVSLGAHNTNIFLHSWDEAKDSAYKDFFQVANQMADSQSYSPILQVSSKYQA